MRIIQKDITTIKEGVIGHQVNLKGVMGAGLARQIKNEWPIVYIRYKDWIDMGPSLGDILAVSVSPTLHVVNLAGQDNFGSKGRDTNYRALEEALDKFHMYSQYVNLPEYLPHGIGCGLAGGDWTLVKDCVDAICPRVTICQLP